LAAAIRAPDTRAMEHLVSAFDLLEQSRYPDILIFNILEKSRFNVDRLFFSLTFAFG